MNLSCFIVYFFAVTFAECSLGDGLILLVFYLLTKLVLFLDNENMVGLTYVEATNTFRLLHVVQ